MSSSDSIRILEPEGNSLGDLFTRLMADLFIALGYKQPRLNVQKPGREFDMIADHRVEQRRAIAECKATAEPIGGAEINKFIGKLDAEGERDKPITGYFISLAGFTESAIEQETQRRRTKLVRLTGSEVIDELVKGRIIVAKERATESAGRCCALRDDLALDPNAELLAHERGWIWAIYYTQGQLRTHFALVHADGTPVAQKLVEGVIDKDDQCNGQLRKMVCLNPPSASSDTDSSRVIAALSAYGRYIEAECGFVSLDGLPPGDLGRRPLILEDFFVPLFLDTDSASRRPVYSVLTKSVRLAILAPPGGGKSTLIKSLAVAYVDPNRRQQIDEHLPEREWLPLFFRCRELRNLTRGSFADLLDAISNREPVRQHASVFRAYVDRALLDGRVLLLVDGLDEIADSGDRAAFVCTLRTALQAYPQIAMLITSREAGFRHVATHLDTVCKRATLSPFLPEDIRRLTIAWHRQVIGNTEAVLSDAHQLANTIIANDRIMRLAINPLLLTTLLLVKRWLGALPTRRSLLYNKAVEVLLRTWNTEGHDPIPEEEALPQLCYVASKMMLTGVQKISRPRLVAFLQEAREALPTELGFVQGTIDLFISRIEERSSLLIMTGLDIEDGRVVEFFEFRHLTFQEFLTARAMVEGWHPNRTEQDTLFTVLEPHFGEAEWREVTPLAAVLGGKATDQLLQNLIKQVKRLNPAQSNSENPVLLTLGSCLADEAPARPETIRAAMSEWVYLGVALRDTYFTSTLAQGRYGSLLRVEAGRIFFSEGTRLLSPSTALAQSVYWQSVGTETLAGYERGAATFLELLRSTTRLRQCEGAFGCAQLCECIANDRISGPETPAKAVWKPRAAYVYKCFLVNNILNNSRLV